MFARKPNPRIIEIDLEITRVLDTMARIEPDAEEYTTARTNWIALCEERDKLLSNRFSKDQILLVGGNVLIAALILGYEQKHVVTTKFPQLLSKSTR
jgi:hypothetical protein